MDPLPPDPVPPDPGAIVPCVSGSVSGGKRRIENNDEFCSSAKKSITNKDLTVASIQNIFIHPSLSISKQYTSNDSGPFLVHVSRDSDLDTDQSIRPIKFGQFLVKSKVSNICTDGVKKVGRNKIAVVFKTAEDANNFLSNPVLDTAKYSASIPSYNITKMGIVRNVPVDLSMDEFVESLVLPNGCGVVLKARRLSRKSFEDGKPTWVPTQTIVITFHGQSLPSRVFSYHTSLPVETYQFPTIQCLNCCRFGHVKAQCRSNARCYRCAQSHKGDECSVVEGEATCLQCSGQHFSTNKSCPEHGRQRSIKLLMSQQNLSYEEASSQSPKVKRPYAEVAQVSNLSQSTYLSSQLSQISSSPSNVSYRKNVFSSSRPRTPLGKTYDRAAHQAIIGDEPSALPNGCSLQSQSLDSSDLSRENNLLEVLLSLIISILSSNNSSIPSHVAQKLTEIISLSNNYGSRHHSAMELKKYPQEKA